MPAGHYDLVACLYVHVAGSVEEMVRRMATGVAPGGILFLVGHRPIDPATGTATPAAGQVQVSVDERQDIYRGSYRSSCELKAAIRGFIDGRNDRACPFIWTKAADGFSPGLTVQGNGHTSGQRRPTDYESARD